MRNPYKLNSAARSRPEQHRRNTHARTRTQASKFRTKKCRNEKRQRRSTCDGSFCHQSQTSHLVKHNMRPASSPGPFVRHLHPCHPSLPPAARCGLAHHHHHYPFLHNDVMAFDPGRGWLAGWLAGGGVENGEGGGARKKDCDICRTRGRQRRAEGEREGEWWGRGGLINQIL